MLKDNKTNFNKVVDTLNNTQYELEDIRDLVRVLYVSLRNQISYEGTPIGISIDNGNSIYPVGEGLQELTRTIEQRLDKTIKDIEDTYNKYVKEEDKDNGN